MTVLTAEARRVIREAIDQRRRELAELSLADCGDGASLWSYRQGCRCGSCKVLSAASRKDRRARGTVNTHGNNGYKNGCRCDTCCEAHRLEDRRRDRRERQRGKQAA